MTYSLYSSIRKYSFDSQENGFNSVYTALETALYESSDYRGLLEGQRDNSARANIVEKKEVEAFAKLLDAFSAFISPWFNIEFYLIPYKKTLAEIKNSEERDLFNEAYSVFFALLKDFSMLKEDEVLKRSGTFLKMQEKLFLAQGRFSQYMQGAAFKSLIPAFTIKSDSLDENDQQAALIAKADSLNTEYQHEKDLENAGLYFSPGPFSKDSFLKNYQNNQCLDLESPPCHLSDLLGVLTVLFQKREKDSYGFGIIGPDKKGIQALLNCLKQDENSFVYPYYLMINTEDLYSPQGWVVLQIEKDGKIELLINKPEYMTSQLYDGLNNLDLTVYLPEKLQKRPEEKQDEHCEPWAGIYAFLLALVQKNVKNEALVKDLSIQVATPIELRDRVWSLYQYVALFQADLTQHELELAADFQEKLKNQDDLKAQEWAAWASTLCPAALIQGMQKLKKYPFTEAQVALQIFGHRLLYSSYTDKDLDNFHKDCYGNSDEMANERLHKDKLSYDPNHNTTRLLINTEEDIDTLRWLLESRQYGHREISDKLSIEIQDKTGFNRMMNLLELSAWPSHPVELIGISKEDESQKKLELLAIRNKYLASNIAPNPQKFNTLARALWHRENRPWLRFFSLVKMQLTQLNEPEKMHALLLKMVTPFAYEWNKQQMLHREEKARKNSILIFVLEGLSVAELKQLQQKDLAQCLNVSSTTAFDLHLILDPQVQEQLTLVETLIQQTQLKEGILHFYLPEADSKTAIQQLNLLGIFLKTQSFKFTIKLIWPQKLQLSPKDQSDLNAAQILFDLEMLKLGAKTRGREIPCKNSAAFLEKIRQPVAEERLPELMLTIEPPKQAKLNLTYGQTQTQTTQLNQQNNHQQEQEQDQIAGMNNQFAAAQRALINFDKHCKLYLALQKECKGQDFDALTAEEEAKRIWKNAFGKELWDIFIDVKAWELILQRPADFSYGIHSQSLPAGMQLDAFNGKQYLSFHEAESIYYAEEPGRLPINAAPAFYIEETILQEYKCQILNEEKLEGHADLLSEKERKYLELYLGVEHLASIWGAYQSELTTLLKGLREHQVDFINFTDFFQQEAEGLRAFKKLRDPSAQALFIGLFALHIKTHQSQGKGRFSTDLVQSVKVFQDFLALLTAQKLVISEQQLADLKQGFGSKNPHFNLTLWCAYQKDILLEVPKAFQQLQWQLSFQINTPGASFAIKEKNYRLVCSEHEIQYGNNDYKAKEVSELFWYFTKPAEDIKCNNATLDFTEFLPGFMRLLAQTIAPSEIESFKVLRGFLNQALEALTELPVLKERFMRTVLLLAFMIKVKNKQPLSKTEFDSLLAFACKDGLHMQALLAFADLVYDALAKKQDQGLLEFSFESEKFQWLVLELAEKNFKEGARPKGLSLVHLNSLLSILKHTILQDNEADKAQIKTIMETEAWCWKKKGMNPQKKQAIESYFSKNAKRFEEVLVEIPGCLKKEGKLVPPLAIEIYRILWLLGFNRNSQGHLESPIQDNSRKNFYKECFRTGFFENLIQDTASVWNKQALSSPFESASFVEVDYSIILKAYCMIASRNDLNLKQKGELAGQITKAIQALNMNWSCDFFPGRDNSFAGILQEQYKAGLVEWPFLAAQYGNPDELKNSLASSAKDLAPYHSIQEAFEVLPFNPLAKKNYQLTALAGFRKSFEKEEALNYYEKEGEFLFTLNTIKLFAEELQGFNPFLMQLWSTASEKLPGKAQCSDCYFKPLPSAMYCWIVAQTNPSAFKKQLDGVFQLAKKYQDYENSYQVTLKAEKVTRTKALLCAHLQKAFFHYFVDEGRLSTFQKREEHFAQWLIVWNFLDKGDEEAKQIESYTRLLGLYTVVSDEARDLWREEELQKIKPEQKKALEEIVSTLEKPKRGAQSLCVLKKSIETKGSAITHYDDLKPYLSSNRVNTGKTNKKIGAWDAFIKDAYLLGGEVFLTALLSAFSIEGSKESSIQQKSLSAPVEAEILRKELENGLARLKNLENPLSDSEPKELKPYFHVDTSLSAAGDLVKKNQSRGRKFLLNDFAKLYQQNPALIKNIHRSPWADCKDLDWAAFPLIDELRSVCGDIYASNASLREKNPLARSQQLNPAALIQKEVIKMISQAKVDIKKHYHFLISDTIALIEKNIAYEADKQSAFWVENPLNQAELQINPIVESYLWKHQEKLKAEHLEPIKIFEAFSEAAARKGLVLEEGFYEQCYKNKHCYAEVILTHKKFNKTANDFAELLQNRLVLHHTMLSYQQIFFKSFADPFEQKLFSVADRAEIKKILTSWTQKTALSNDKVLLPALNLTLKCLQRSGGRRYRSSLLKVFLNSNFLPQCFSTYAYEQRLNELSQLLGQIFTWDLSGPEESAVYKVLLQVLGDAKIPLASYSQILQQLKDFSDLEKTATAFDLSLKEANLLFANIINACDREPQHIQAYLAQVEWLLASYQTAKKDLEGQKDQLEGEVKFDLVLRFLNQSLENNFFPEPPKDQAIFWIMAQALPCYQQNKNIKEEKKEAFKNTWQQLLQDLKNITKEKKAALVALYLNSPIYPDAKRLSELLQNPDEDPALAFYRCPRSQMVDTPLKPKEGDADILNFLQDIKVKRKDPQSNVVSTEGLALDVQLRAREDFEQIQAHWEFYRSKSYQEIQYYINNLDEPNTIPSGLTARQHRLLLSMKPIYLAQHKPNQIQTLQLILSAIYHPQPLQFKMATGEGKTLTQIQLALYLCLEAKERNEKVQVLLASSRLSVSLRDRKQWKNAAAFLNIPTYLGEAPDEAKEYAQLVFSDAQEAKLGLQLEKYQGNAKNKPARKKIAIVDESDWLNENKNDLQAGTAALKEKIPLRFMAAIFKFTEENEALLRQGPSKDIFPLLIHYLRQADETLRTASTLPAGVSFDGIINAWLTQIKNDDFDKTILEEYLSNCLQVLKMKEGVEFKLMPFEVYQDKEPVEYGQVRLIDAVERKLLSEKTQYSNGVQFAVDASMQSKHPAHEIYTQDRQRIATRTSSRLPADFEGLYLFSGTQRHIPEDFMHANNPVAQINYRLNDMPLIVLPRQQVKQRQIHYHFSGCDFKKNLCDLFVKIENQDPLDPKLVVEEDAIQAAESAKALERRTGRSIITDPKEFKAAIKRGEARQYIFLYTSAQADPKESDKILERLVGHPEVLCVSDLTRRATDIKVHSKGEANLKLQVIQEAKEKATQTQISGRTGRNGKQGMVYILGHLDKMNELFAANSEKNFDFNEIPAEILKLKGGEPLSLEEWAAFYRDLSPIEDGIEIVKKPKMPAYLCNQSKGEALSLNAERFLCYYRSWQWLIEQEQNLNLVEQQRRSLMEEYSEYFLTLRMNNSSNEKLDEEWPKALTRIADLELKAFNLEKESQALENLFGLLKPDFQKTERLMPRLSEAELKLKRYFDQEPLNQVSAGLMHALYYLKDKQSLLDWVETLSSFDGPCLRLLEKRLGTDREFDKVLQMALKKWLSMQDKDLKHLKAILLLDDRITELENIQISLPEITGSESLFKQKSFLESHKQALEKQLTIANDANQFYMTFEGFGGEIQEKMAHYQQLLSKTKALSSTVALNLECLAQYQNEAEDLIQNSFEQLREIPVIFSLLDKESFSLEAYEKHLQKQYETSIQALSAIKTQEIKEAFTFLDRFDVNYLFFNNFLALIEEKKQAIEQSYDLGRQQIKALSLRHEKVLGLKKLQELSTELTQPQALFERSAFDENLQQRLDKLLTMENKLEPFEPEFQESFAQYNQLIVEQKSISTQDGLNLALHNALEDQEKIETLIQQSIEQIDLISLPSISLEKKLEVLAHSIEIPPLVQTKETQEIDDKKVLLFPAVKENSQDWDVLSEENIEPQEIEPRDLEQVLPKREALSPGGKELNQVFISTEGMLNHFNDMAKLYVKNKYKEGSARRKAYDEAMEDFSRESKECLKNILVQNIPASTNFFKAKDKDLLKLAREKFPLHRSEARKGLVAVVDFFMLCSIVGTILKKMITGSYTFSGENSTRYNLFSQHLKNHRKGMGQKNKEQVNIQQSLPK